MHRFYKGYHIVETDSMTTVKKSCFGHPYESCEYLFEIYKDGLLVKPCGKHPFITSIAAAKAWCNDGTR